MGALTRKGKRIDREIFAGQSDRDQERIDLIASSPDPFMQRAVVLEVIFDPNAVSKEIQQLFEEEELLNPDELQRAPRNSVIATIVSAASAKRDPTPAVFLPMFSHTHEPVKPGEHVWVFFEDPSRTRAQGYWVSRIVAPSDVDDTNFTHMDRRFIDQFTPKTVDRFEESLMLQSPDVGTRLRAASLDGPRFPNGAETEESFTLPDIDGYEKINQDAIANRVSTFEPVPRYNKRPSDWSAEGSNNSLVVLGEDRTGPAAKLKVEAGATKVDGTPDGDKRGLAGMVDIVVGRGLGPERKMPTPGAIPKMTQPKVIMNARGALETDKAPKGGQDNTSEGDPDFEHDAARFYAAMDTDLDKNFGKPLPKLNGDADPTVVDGGAAIIAKSTNARVIAREDGTIRIIKEGVEDDEGGKGRAIIMIEPDGTIMIDGPRIIVGSGIEKENGAGQQVFIGRDAEEPIPMGNALKNLLSDYVDDINTHVSTFADTLQQQLSAPPGLLGNFGIPLPGMAAIVAAVVALKSSVSSAKATFDINVDSMLSRVGKTK